MRKKIIFVAGYIDVDCGLNMFDIPSVTGILDLGACCSIDCKGDACTQTEIDDCKRVGLSVDDATYDAKCRFQVDTVRPAHITAVKMT